MHSASRQSGAIVRRLHAAVCGSEGRFAQVHDPGRASGERGRHPSACAASSTKTKLTSTFARPADAKLEFSLNAYGIDAVNTTIDLCSLLGGILCPLPTYDFVGSATLPLPAEVGDSIDIPGIGYWIPDLEATATGASSRCATTVTGTARADGPRLS